MIFKLEMQKMTISHFRRKSRLVHVRCGYRVYRVSLDQSLHSDYLTRRTHEASLHVGILLRFLFCAVSSTRIYDPN